MFRFKFLLSISKDKEQQSTSSSANSLFFCSGEMDTKILIVISNLLYVSFEVVKYFIG
jgi:hypothetical protein